MTIGKKLTVCSLVVGVSAALGFTFANYEHYLFSFVAYAISFFIAYRIGVPLYLDWDDSRKQLR